MMAMYLSVSEPEDDDPERDNPEEATYTSIIRNCHSIAFFGTPRMSAVFHLGFGQGSQSGRL